VDRNNTGLVINSGLQRLAYIRRPLLLTLPVISKIVIGQVILLVAMSKTLSPSEIGLISLLSSGLKLIFNIINPGSIFVLTYIEASARRSSNNGYIITIAMAEGMLRLLVCSLIILTLNSGNLISFTPVSTISSKQATIYVCGEFLTYLWPLISQVLIIRGRLKLFALSDFVLSSSRALIISFFLYYFKGIGYSSLAGFSYGYLAASALEFIVSVTCMYQVGINMPELGVFNYYRQVGLKSSWVNTIETLPSYIETWLIGLTLGPASLGILYIARKLANLPYSLSKAMIRASVQDLRYDYQNCDSGTYSMKYKYFPVLLCAFLLAYSALLGPLCSIFFNNSYSYSLFPAVVLNSLALIGLVGFPSLNYLHFTGLYSSLHKKIVTATFLQLALIFTFCKALGLVGAAYGIVFSTFLIQYLNYRLAKSNGYQDYSYTIAFSTSVIFIILSPIVLLLKA